MIANKGKTKSDFRVDSKPEIMFIYSESWEKEVFLDRRIMGSDFRLSVSELSKDITQIEYMHHAVRLYRYNKDIGATYGLRFSKVMTMESVAEQIDDDIYQDLIEVMVSIPLSVVNLSSYGTVTVCKFRDDGLIKELSWEDWEANGFD